MDANRCSVRIDPDLEARRDHDLVIVREGIDMLDLGDALDDGLQRLADQLDGVRRPQARGRHHDVDHGHADLRFLLAGDRREGQQADRNGGQQEQGREGRTDGRPGQTP